MAERLLVFVDVIVTPTVDLFVWRTLRAVHRFSRAFIPITSETQPARPPPFGVGSRRMGWPRRRRAVPVYWHEAYRPPLTSLELGRSLNPRRSDFALWYLLHARVLQEGEVRRPISASFEALARVHTPEYLESLFSPATLGAIFSVDPTDVPVDALLESVRLAVGGTVSAARDALSTRGPVVNLSGGFHHAAPGRGGGFCAVNDVAVALAVLRAEGFGGGVGIMDLDAHPPDGIEACLRSDEKVWIGSLSATRWGELGRVVERVLPEGATDRAYLYALGELLAQRPRAALWFVIAGGDVLAGDPLGKLGMTLEGARQRDAEVARVLDGIPSVWLPGGGYHRDAWKVLAGTVLELGGHRRRQIPEGFDPLTARFRRLSRQLNAEVLHGSLDLRAEDVEEDLRLPRPSSHRLLGFYTLQGIEYGLFRYGLLPFLQRVGYDPFDVVVEATEVGDRLTVYGHAEGQRHLLVECVLARRTVEGAEYLFVNWLSLRNPRSSFSALRPRLPGQEVPGLGLAREVAEVLRRVARRLGLAGLVFRPAWYHLAVIASGRFRFVSPERQGRFEALRRDLGDRSLLEATTTVAEQRVSLGGVPYAWEADDMIWPVEERDFDEGRVAAERERCRYEVREG